MASNRNFFSDIQHEFLEVPSDGLIRVDSFLAACDEVVKLLDLLKITTDIPDNIAKLRNKHHLDPNKFSTFQAMLLDEQRLGTVANGNSATIALLWLKRALECMLAFMSLIVSDHKTGTPSPTLAPLARQAYDGTLRQYHNWFIRNFFMMIMGLVVPKRHDLMKILAGEGHQLEGLIIERMDSYTVGLSENLGAINQLFETLQINS